MYNLINFPGAGRYGFKKAVPRRALQHIMPLSKEIQEQMRNKIIDMYKSGKGFKAISKALGLQRSMVRAIIHKWLKLGTALNLPRSSRPTKNYSKTAMMTHPGGHLKKLQTSLASNKISVHDSTIRKRLGKNAIHGRVPRQKPLLTKKNIKARLTFAKKISWLSPILLIKYSVDWWDRCWTFWKVRIPLHLA